MLSSILTRLACDHNLFWSAVGCSRFKSLKGLHLMPSDSRLIRQRSFFKLPEPSEPFRRKKDYSHHRKLGYPIEKMFGIAADVNRYKEFVPWCIGSKIVRKVDERCSEVQLTVGFPPVVESYVSTSVSSDTRLFKQLISIWQFYVVDSDPANTCHLSFSVGYKVMYEFQSPLHAAIASLFFDEVTKKMIVAFTERARTLYGPPSAVV
ncbi:hypothetical protein M514_18731 [Trichuris suis]|uniref:Coenzyme Q-binding protein COQ10 START domain-containing protein n=1 Tax=Trichuris suis TaxID=68888 RepID=A0A085NI58_9BILA|nr:hypothetical protein M514_18731 [Trichuris suis]